MTSLSESIRDAIEKKSELELSTIILQVINRERIHFSNTTEDIKHCVIICILNDSKFREKLKNSIKEKGTDIIEQYQEAFKNYNQEQFKPIIKSLVSGQYGHYTLKMMYTSIDYKTDITDIITIPEIHEKKILGICSRTLPDENNLYWSGNASDLSKSLILEIKSSTNETFFEKISKKDNEISDSFVQVIGENNFHNLQKYVCSEIEKTNYNNPSKQIPLEVKNILFPLKDKKYDNIIPILSSNVVFTLNSLNYTKKEENIKRNKMFYTQNGGSKPQNGGQVCNEASGKIFHFISKCPNIVQYEDIVERFKYGKLDITAYIKKKNNITIKDIKFKELEFIDSQLIRLEHQYNTFTSQNFTEWNSNEQDKYIARMKKVIYNIGIYLIEDFRYFIDQIKDGVPFESTTYTKKDVAYIIKNIHDNNISDKDYDILIFNMVKRIEKSGIITTNNKFKYILENVLYSIAKETI